MVIENDKDTTWVPTQVIYLTTVSEYHSINHRRLPWFDEQNVMLFSWLSRKLLELLYLIQNEIQGHLCGSVG